MSETAKVTILVVDDDQLIINTLRRILTRACYAVEVAFSEDSAIAGLKKKPALVLTDLHIGLNGNGWIVCREAKLLGIPRILMTALPPLSPDVDEVADALWKKGVDSVADLLGHIKRLTARSS